MRDLTLRIFVSVIIGMIAVYMIGCDEGDEGVGFKVEPPDGSTITPDTIITITFDKEPLEVISFPILTVDFGKIEEAISVTFVSLRGGNFSWELVGRELKLKLKAVELPFGNVLEIPEGELTMNIGRFDDEHSHTYSYTVVRK